MSPIQILRLTARGPLLSLTVPIFLTCRYHIPMRSPNGSVPACLDPIAMGTSKLGIFRPSVVLVLVQLYYQVAVELYGCSSVPPSPVRPSPVRPSAAASLARDVSLRTLCRIQV